MDYFGPNRPPLRNPYNTVHGLFSSQQHCRIEINLQIINPIFAKHSICSIRSPFLYTWKTLNFLVQLRNTLDSYGRRQWMIFCSGWNLDWVIMIGGRTSKCRDLLLPAIVSHKTQALFGMIEYKVFIGDFLDSVVKSKVNPRQIPRSTLERH